MWWFNNLIIYNVKFNLFYDFENTFIISSIIISIFLCACIRASCITRAQILRVQQLWITQITMRESYITYYQYLNYAIIWKKDLTFYFLLYYILK